MILEVFEEAQNVEVRSTIIGSYLIVETSSGRSITLKKEADDEGNWDIILLNFNKKLAIYYG